MFASRRSPRGQRALSGLLAYSLVAGLLATLLGPVVAPAPASAEDGPGGTRIRQANTFYAYVGAGENLDVLFTKAAQNGTTPSDVVVTVRGPGGETDSCTVTDAAAVDATCSLTDLTSPTAGVWSVEFRPVGTLTDYFTWEIEVQDGTTAMPGRVWTDRYVMAQGTTGSVDFGLTYVSREGFVYDAQYRGYNGVDSVITSDAAGNTFAGTCTSAYLSYDAGDARYATPGTCGDRYKIFFDSPAADLPETATFPGGSSSWVLPEVMLPDLTSLEFDQTSPTGRSGTFTVAAANFTGQMQVQIDVNGDGDYSDPEDVELPLGVTGDGTASVEWDGLDGQGNPVPYFTDLNARALIDRTGEIHFTMNDVELRAGGIEVTAVNGPGAGSNTLYWNDTGLAVAGRDCPTPQPDGTAGVDSTGGVHEWTCFIPGQQSWGDVRAIDDWTYHSIEEEFEIELPGEPQPVWQCTPGGLLFQNPNGQPPLDIIDVDLASGAAGAPTVTPDWLVNAVGYNTVDNYIYGWGGNADAGVSPQLVRVGSDGSVDPLGDIPGFTGTNAADVDENGHYWAFHPINGDWWQIDLATLTLVDSGNVGLGSFTTGGADWVYIPGTNKLWRIATTAGAPAAYLIGFDRTTKTWTTPVNLGQVGDNITGASFGDANGFIYASFNNTGEIWRIDPRTNDAELFAEDGPPSAGNDGARCVDAPLPIDFGDAPEGYGTLLSDNGPRHSLPGFDADTSTAPLMIGETVDIDTDGVPTAAADGDGADEDGTANPLEISATTPTVVLSATNNTGEPATLAGWIDLDADGTFEAGERVTVTVPASSGTADYTLEFPAATASAGVFARFRLFPGNVADPAPTGTAAAGEVEDYAVLVRSLEVEKTSTATAESRIGDTVTYTVTVTNTGSVAYTDEAPARVQDDLSGVLDDATLDETSIVASAGTATLTGSRLTWSGALAPEESVTITYDVTLTAAGDGVVENVAFQTVCPTDDADCDPTPPPLEECAEGGIDPDTGLACDSVSFELPKLEILKTVDPAEILREGDVLTYTVTATNTGPGDYTAARPAVVLDDLTAVLDDATIDPATITASAGAVPTYSEPIIRWSGELVSGATVTITYEVTYTAAGDTELVNVAFGPQCAADDPSCTTPPPTPQCDPAEGGVDPTTGIPCDRVRLPGPLLEVTKSVDPAKGTSVAAGEELTYTITFDNDGTAPAAVDGWTDVLAGVLDDAEITSGPAAGEGDLTVSAVADGELTVDGTVPVGGSYTVTYTVEVRPDGERGDNLLGNFVLEPGVVDPPAECLADDPRCTTNPVSEIVDTKSTTPEDGSVVQSGDEITYTLTFSNIGEGAGAVDRVDDLTHLLDDADVTVAPVPSDPALSVSEIVDGRFSIIGELAADQTVTVTYTVVVKDADAMGDAVLANYLLDPEEETPEEPVCEEGDEDCTTHTAPKVVDSKSVDPETGSEVVSGDELTYTLTFSNEGTAAGQVDRVDDLTHLLDDADVVAAPVASDAALTVSEIADGRFAITGELAPEQTVTVTYTVVVRDADDMGDGVLANFLLDPEDPPVTEPTCEEGDEDCTTNPAPKVVDTKSVDPTSGTAVQPGAELTYTLTFTNEGAAPGEVDRVDDLTHVLDDAEVVSGPVASDDALAVSELADDRFSVTGELAAGQTVTVTYTVQVNGAGELGDSVLANFLLDPSDETPEEPVCTDAEDCTSNPVSDISVVKSADPVSGTEVEQGEEITYTLTFTNIGAGAGAVDYTDHMAGVLDDATVTEFPTPSEDVLTVAEGDDQYTVQGTLAAGQTVTVSYTVQVREWAEQGDHVLGNFVTPTGQEPPAGCEADSLLCTEHPAEEPPADEPPASGGNGEQPPAQTPGGGGQLPNTGAPAVLLPLLAGLVLALVGSGLLVRRRTGLSRR
ncbi:DUF11 domain-containing protein [Auraticoccus sp. F435]|uniref:DUF11 domain-containing protein n=1 Tax=Auraticoccus cholistanensis TaxID=2656650 RepID=A0A6A9UQV7_9ACTN|nr:GEVED domain-containing protein [Auraticoccus cholistanensis]MVA75051.1 DUF11 domain-containing protein [Auraticoccus cholistanensis]